MSSETPVSSNNTSAPSLMRYHPDDETVLKEKNYIWRITKTSNNENGLKKTVPPIPQDFYKSSNSESPAKGNFYRVIANPFVPMGIIITSICMGGKYSLSSNLTFLGIVKSLIFDKNKARGTFWMHARVVAQGLTVAAAMAGIGAGLFTSQSKTDKAVDNSASDA